MSVNPMPTAPPPYSVSETGGTYGFTPPQSYPSSVPPKYPPEQAYSNQAYPQPQPYSQPQQIPVTHQPLVIYPQNTTNQTVVVMGGCPSCRVGTLEDSYTCCGILCAICLFPCGILCCLCMKEKKCTHCGATF